MSFEERGRGEGFDFPEHYEPVPGLLDQVRHLRSQGRPRSALDAVLQVLRHDGKSAGAFAVALPLCREAMRAGGRASAEPVTEEQLTSPYLAPIATECSACVRFWFSGHPFLAGDSSSVTVSNPVGVQCPNCRYTLCRNCVTGDLSCPEPDCTGSLGVPVRATGRPRGMPENPHRERVECVIILSRTTPATAQECRAIIDLVCTWQPTVGTRIMASAFGDGRPIDDKDAWTAVYSREHEGRLSPGAMERTRIAEVVNDDRRIMVAVVAAPADRQPGPTP